MDGIKDAAKAFILENCLPGEDPRNLTEETELRESGILDSMATLKLVYFLEERFEVEFEANDLEPGNLSTLRSIEHLVKSKMEHRS